MKKLFLAILLGFGLFRSTTVYAQESGEIPSMSQQERVILSETNKLRTAKGLNMLTTFAALQNAAETRAAEQVTTIGHSRPNGSSWDTIFTQFSVSRSFSGENIAIGWYSPENAMYGWKTSPAHYANLMNPNYLHLGIGYYHEDSSTYKDYYVQLFTSGCNISKFEVINLPASYSKGSTIEDLDMWVRVSCNHGDTYAPVISEMVQGYKASLNSVQRVSVFFNGMHREVTLGTNSIHSSKKNNSVAVPFKVTTFNLKKQKDSIRLTWKGSKNSIKYQIYRSVDGKAYKRILTTSKKKYTDKNIRKGHEYRYKIRGLNLKGSIKKVGRFSGVRKTTLGGK